MAISLIPANRKMKGQKVSQKETQSLKREYSSKRGFAHMQKHGVIMDVTNVETTQIAEEAGAVAVMVLDKLPYDVRKAGGVANNSWSKND